jgi:Lsr2
MTMAQRIEVSLVDDIDGERADETVTFSLDGLDYEIDLSDVNAADLRERLEFYVEHARRMLKSKRKGAPRSVATTRKSPTTTRTQVPADPAAVRAWAAGKKITVSPRGRISKDVYAQFEADQATGPASRLKAV